ncbi:MAG TPA: response regulator transcription factor [Methylomirabilota bacterium]|nr:response regulator transcription factor [Methylomirabilota bacterium]
MNSRTRIRIVVVDDHTVVRHGLRQLLSREADMEVVGETGTGLEAIHIADVMRPDVMLLDAKLGDIDGPEVCRRVLAVSPRTAVVMLTGHLQDGLVLLSLAAGAKGYLVKDVELAEVTRTIRAVYRGQSVLDPKVATRVIANATTTNGRSPLGLMRALDETDRAIVKLIATGFTNKQIAVQVHLSAHTIKDRLEKIAGTFGVRTRTEVVVEAIRAGLV